MALPKVQEVRQLSDEELAQEIINQKQQLFQLRFDKATRRLEQTHQFKHTRHRLAQLLTVERERQLGIDRSGAKSQSATTSNEED
jgi:large subunit ribosomal protein L29